MTVPSDSKEAEARALAAVDRLEAKNARILALLAVVERYENALRRIADGRLGTRTASDPLPAYIDGKETTVTYAEYLTARDVARRVLAGTEESDA